MDSQDFQGWLSAAGGLTRAQRREALAVLSGRSAGEASKAAIELDEARRCPHCARSGFARHGAGPAAYQCKGCGRTQRARHPAVGPAPQGALAVGEAPVKAWRTVPRVPLASGRRRGVSGCAQGHRGGGRDVHARKGARKLGRKARRRGGKAKKRGLSREQVPVLMAADRGGTTFSAVLPRVDAVVLTAALDPVLARDALLVSDGGASYPPCAAALGVSHESLNRSMGERVRGLHVRQPPQPLEGLPATAPGRCHPLSGQL